MTPAGICGGALRPAGSHGRGDGSPHATSIALRVAEYQWLSAGFSGLTAPWECALDPGGGYRAFGLKQATMND